MKQNSKRKKLRHIPFSIIFWTVFTLVMTTLFFCNRGAIAKTVSKLQGTHVAVKPDNIAQDVENIIEKKMSEDELNSKAKNVEEEKLTFKTKASESSNNPLNEEEVQREQITLHSDKSTQTNNQVESAKKDNDIKNALSAKSNYEIPNTEEMQERDIEVYFATVSDSGTVARERCIRTIAKSASPMVDSIHALLEGPTKDEAKRGIRSFIPAETKLLSASIKDGNAMLNFSEDFQFNRYGAEGYNVQLQQIVFTACSFPTVNSVQFLIEGQKRDFIGSEGIWIGSPFTPSYF